MWQCLCPVGHSVCINGLQSVIVFLKNPVKVNPLKANFKKWIGLSLNSANISAYKIHEDGKGHESLEEILSNQTGPSKLKIMQYSLAGRIVCLEISAIVDQMELLVMVHAGLGNASIWGMHELVVLWKVSLISQCGE